MIRISAIAGSGRHRRQLAQYFTSKELTSQRAACDDPTLTHQLCIADGANDNAPIGLTKSQLAALFNQSPAATQYPCKHCLRCYS